MAVPVALSRPLCTVLLYLEKKPAWVTRRILSFAEEELDTRGDVCKHLDMSIFVLEELERFAEIFKALASPHRLAIFLRLMSNCPPGKTCDYDAEIRECVGDVGRDLGIARTTVSHHVKELRRAGLLKVERRGRNIECWLGYETVCALIDLLSGHVKLGTLSEDTASKQGHEMSPSV